jgi:hypothetical protein
MTTGHRLFEAVKQNRASSRQWEESLRSLAIALYQELCKLFAETRWEVWVGSPETDEKGKYTDRLVGRISPDGGELVIGIYLPDIFEAPALEAFVLVCASPDPCHFVLRIGDELSGYLLPEKTSEFCNHIIDRLCSTLETSYVALRVVRIGFPANNVGKT